MTYQQRIRELEEKGLTTSDAQSVADVEAQQGRVFEYDPAYPNDPGE